MRSVIDIWLRNPFVLLNETKNVLYSPALFIYLVLQKFFDLERENACATKEQKNHSFPKLNRNKYMVTDGAAYIGRCQGREAPWGIVQVGGGLAVLFHAPWGSSTSRAPASERAALEVRKQEGRAKSSSPEFCMACFLC